MRHTPDHDHDKTGRTTRPAARRGNKVGMIALLGIAALGGYLLVNGNGAYAPVKPATGSAQAMALASDGGARH